VIPFRTFSFAEASRYAHIWLPGYLRSRWARRHRPEIRRVWLTIGDHYEPHWANADRDVAISRVRAWSHSWPRIANQFEDAVGRPAKYTFFYPQEEYRPELLDPLAEMTQAGIADVEVHLHHDGEGEQDFVDRISSFTEVLHGRHGLLRKIDGRIAFGFIHGNWALDNSGPHGRHCGLNNEISLLRQLGCYADFTFPAASHPAQPRMVNTIYWATDDPARPKSYNSGVPVVPGGPVIGDLMMIPGPLGLHWGAGRLVPGIEVGELAEHNPVSRERIRLWIENAPSIGGDVFIKLFAHGAQERNARPLLTRDLQLMFGTLLQLCRDSGAACYFVSAWEMWKAITALRSQANPVATIVNPYQGGAGVALEEPTVDQVSWRRSR